MLVRSAQETSRGSLFLGLGPHGWPTKAKKKKKKGGIVKSKIALSGPPKLIILHHLRNLYLPVAACVLVVLRAE